MLHWLHYWKFTRLYLWEAAHFLRTKSTMTKNDQLRLSLRFAVHTIEKNLVENQHRFLQNEAWFIHLLAQCEQLIADKAFAETNVVEEIVSAVHEAARYAKNMSIEFQGVENRLIEFLKVHPTYQKIERIISISKVCGAELIKTGTYAEFLGSRHSIREFKPTLIGEETILKIIELGLKCPSACNRQAFKVFYTMDFLKQEQLINLNKQPCGRTIFNYLVVCAVTEDYREYDLFQSYVNGGIFLYSLVNAIHSMGYGSCMFGMPKQNKNYEKYKSLLEIPESYDIIGLIGYGEIPDIVSYIQMHRKPVDEVAINR